MHIMLMYADIIIRSENWDKTVQSCSLVPRFNSVAIIKALRHLLSDTLKKLDAAIMWKVFQSEL